MSGHTGQKAASRSKGYAPAAAARDDPGVLACSQCGGPMTLIERLMAFDLARESSRADIVNTP